MFFVGCISDDDKILQYVILLLVSQMRKNSLTGKLINERKFLPNNFRERQERQERRKRREGRKRQELPITSTLFLLFIGIFKISRDIYQEQAGKNSQELEVSVVKWPRIYCPEIDNFYYDTNSWICFYVTHFLRRCHCWVGDGGGGVGVVMKSMIKCRLYLISQQLLIEPG
jgi:hypothetical protein